ncbi:MAG: valine--tRNA ligase [Candidatus Omnitrophica bacterium]|nr:valine--tRNA ligase [Candidatus Omnitrophota bacterium]
MSNIIPTRYEPKEIEERIYAEWEEKKLFRADESSQKSAYSIVIPPPNVTGVLHMGHALNNTIQDILVRWKRMQGYDTLWLPGTDHAGIATQNVVERALAKEKRTRADMGRDKFLERVWQWKEEYGGTIIHQLKRLGCSCDWTRTRFTMDKGLSEAVMEVFKRLFEDRLLYKGDYIINWCPRCGTALSDEEAEHRDLSGKLYYIKYQVEGALKLEIENKDYIVVATTRPETLLGDVAVAVNPDDERYSWLEGKKVILPILKRRLDVIFDKEVDPSFGTGALKVTPAHDPVDFALAVKHDLKPINAMNNDGTINENGGEYQGLDRFEAREAIVEELKQRHQFVKMEDHDHSVGHCYRCHTVVEPRLSKQWFVRMKPLAVEGIQVVNEGKIRFHPERWTKVYLNWMENIRDWCVSRQIWWGHRIPVWYCVDCLGGKSPRDVEVDGPGVTGVFLVTGEEKTTKCPFCGGGNTAQDPDVLDTWFSSWLWPFSTMGWPRETAELTKFYPTDALVTAQEIIFFWVARMIMAGLKFREDIPFRDVYIHGTVRDSTGTKMSKSLGNVIDPLEVIQEVGADALRYSIISITSQGQDVFLSKDKFEFGRNFANKLWNASRYVMMNMEDHVPGKASAGNDLAGKWIMSAYNQAVDDVQKSLVAFRFNDAASALYEFVWHKYCDWYLELSKLSEDKVVTREILITVLDGILRLMHPFMPFITEEIWQKLPSKNGEFLMTSGWPVFDETSVDLVATNSMEALIAMITAVRNIRSFWNIEPKVSVDVVFKVENKRDAALISENSVYVEKLGRCSIKEISEKAARPGKSVSSLVNRIKVFVLLGDAIDLEKEGKRISDRIEELQNYLITLEKKLDNKDFVSRAPAEIVEKEKSKKEKFTREVRTLKENLEAIK